MKRRIKKKLLLAKETLHDLQLREVSGASVTCVRSECGSCPPSACHETFCCNTLFGC